MKASLALLPAGAAGMAVFFNRRLRSKAEFLSLVSHEMRTPLTLIRLYASRLQKDPQVPDPQRRAMDVVLEETERL